MEWTSNSVRRLWVAVYWWPALDFSISPFIAGGDSPFHARSGGRVGRVSSRWPIANSPWRTRRFTRHLGDAAAAIVIVWVINLFNFMDGIDGIAASEAAFIGCAGGALTFLYVHDLAVGYSAWAIGAAALAFLWWNWPPAKIFMGDVGSCYLGYAIAVLGLAAGRSSPVASLAWLILGGVFYADATTTLLVRLARRQRIYLAHRDHAYQSLARQWNSHRSVTLLVFAINLVAPLPLAVLAFLYQEWAVAIAAITLLCLSAAVLLLHIFKPSF